MLSNNVKELANNYNTTIEEAEEIIRIGCDVVTKVGCLTDRKREKFLKFYFYIMLVSSLFFSLYQWYDGIVLNFNFSLNPWKIFFSSFFAGYGLVLALDIFITNLTKKHRLKVLESDINSFICEKYKNKYQINIDRRIASRLFATIYAKVTITDVLSSIALIKTENKEVL